MKIYTLVLVIVMAAFSLQAQEIRLTIYGNYVFDDKVDSYIDTYNYFTGTIQGGLLWGGSVALQLADNSVELLYLRQSTEVPVRYYDYSSFGEKQAKLDLGINWIMLGGTRTLLPDDKLEPYAGIMLGIALIDGKNPETQKSASATKFAWGLRMGLNYWLTSSLGVKFQSQLLCATQAAGGSLYFSTGGAGAAVTAYSSMLQFSLGGGLVLKLKKGKQDSSK